MRFKTSVIVAMFVFVVAAPNVAAQLDPAPCPWECYYHGPDWTECWQKFYFSGDMFDCTEVCIWWPATMCWCRGDGCIEV